MEFKKILFNKNLILISIFILIFLSISTISAVDDAGNYTDTANNNTNIPEEISTNENNNTEINNINTTTATANTKLKITLTPSKLSTTYGSGKYFKIKAIDSESKKAVSKLKVLLKVYTGKKYKTTTVTTNSQGIAQYSASTLAIGTHKIISSVKDSNIISKAKTSSVKITKAKLTIKAPKVTNYYKIKDYFKVMVKNKETNKAMKNIKVITKIFTGSKYKQYTLKTNKNGVININTKFLSKSTHKVTVNVKNTAKVKAANTKSTIKITEPSSINIKVNDKTLNVKLENNDATKALVEKLKKGDVTVRAKEYGNFEKVGDLGFSLPTSDKQITTSPGDLVLYNGDEISLFYNSNSWSYTKLGKVQNVDANELKTILGSGDVTFKLSLK